MGDRGSTASGGEDGVDPLLEPLVECCDLLFVEVGVADQHDTRLGEGRDQPVGECCVEPLNEAGHPGHDVVDLLGGRSPVGGRSIETRGHLILQCADPDLEELVEVGGHNRAESGSLEQGDSRFRRQLKNPVVKRQPAQLPVEKPLIGSAPLRAVRSGQRKSDRRRRVGGARVSRRWPGRQLVHGLADPVSRCSMFRSTRRSLCHCHVSQFRRQAQSLKVR